MHTIEINEGDWDVFFRTVSERAQDRPVRVEVEGAELGDQEMGDLLPFVELAVERKGSEAGEVLLTVEGPAGELTHRVDRPVKVYALQNDAGELKVVDIEGADGTKTLVYFERLPEIPGETHAP